MSENEVKKRIRDRTGSFYSILTRNNKAWERDRKWKKGLGWTAELWERDWGIYRRNRGMLRATLEVSFLQTPPSHTCPSQKVLCLA